MQQSHTFASRTSRYTSLCVQKSVPISTQTEIQDIFPSPSKKLKYPKRKPTGQRQLNSAMTMVYRHRQQNASW